MIPLVFPLSETCFTATKCYGHYSCLLFQTPPPSPQRVCPPFSVGTMLWQRACSYGPATTSTSATKSLQTSDTTRETRQKTPSKTTANPMEIGLSWSPAHISLQRSSSTFRCCCVLCSVTCGAVGGWFWCMWCQHWDSVPGRPTLGTSTSLRIIQNSDLP